MSDRTTRQRIRVREPAADAERRPLLSRAVFSHSMEDEPFFSCSSNAHSHLPVYTNIHRIRRDVTSIVEDYLTFEQLRDLRLNISVVRPLVDKLYELDDISIVYCLLVNRSQFLHEQEHMTNRQNVNFSRAILCEVVATRILRRFGDDNPGPQGLLLLANILVAGFEPFQNAPEEVRNEARITSSWNYPRTLPALEIAILSESKYFLGSTHCQRVINAIYVGQVIYTPSTFLDMIPDRYKQKPISLYNPRNAPILDQYRLIVPRTRNIVELVQFVVLLFLYILFMVERDPTQFSVYEIAFSVYAFGWVLEQFATNLEHGWNVYSQNLWSFLDVMFALVYWVYLILRIHGWRTGEIDIGQQAVDVLAIGAPFLVPRLAFNLFSDNILFLSLRSMMADFALLTLLAAWSFCGFLLSMVWLAEGRHNFISIGKWMLWIWFGLDATGIQKSVNFHWLLGPILMVTFAFLGNTLFLTILVSMLSNTFSTIVANATAEIAYRKAVLTLEGVKSDAIFSYPPPFNIMALFVLVPMKFFVSPRWFHKIHVASVRAINLPTLLLIAILERRHLWADGMPYDPAEQKPRPKAWFWEKWKITTHGDVQAVFEIPPPHSVEDDIAIDDDLTQHAIRKQFAAQRHNAPLTNTPKPPNATAPENKKTGPPNLTAQDSKKSSASLEATPRDKTMGHRTPGRRDSMEAFGSDLTEQVRQILNSSTEMEDLSIRLDNLEDMTSRIEDMLSRMCGVNEAEERSLEQDEQGAIAAGDLE